VIAERGLVAPTVCSADTPAASSSRRWCKRMGTARTFGARRVPRVYDAGDRVHIRPAAGGGYGNPIKREPDVFSTMSATAMSASKRRRALWRGHSIGFTQGDVAATAQRRKAMAHSDTNACAALASPPDLGRSIPAHVIKRHRFGRGIFIIEGKRHHSPVSRASPRFRVGTASRSSTARPLSERSSRAGFSTLSRRSVPAGRIAQSQRRGSTHVIGCVIR